MTKRIDQILSNPERTNENIIPLNVHIYKGWDHFEPVIRPLPLEAGEVDDGRRTKVQFLCLNITQDPANSRFIYHDRSQQEIEEIGGYADWKRRADNGARLPLLTIRTGDVKYLLKTTDPDKEEQDIIQRTHMQMDNFYGGVRQGQEGKARCAQSK